LRRSSVWAIPKAARSCSGQQPGPSFSLPRAHLAISGAYEWHQIGPRRFSADSEEVAAFLANRRQFDPDLWLLELDIAEPERFIAETTASG
jgi:hypothetical protein